MAEYIKREDVAQILDNAQMISDGEYSGYCTEDIDLNSIPAADVATVRRGKWILVRKQADGGLCKCSECGREFEFNSCNRHTSYLYCPNCGAKMDKED